MMQYINRNEPSVVISSSQTGRFCHAAAAAAAQQRRALQLSATDKTFTHHVYRTIGDIHGAQN